MTVFQQVFWSNSLIEALGRLKTKTIAEDGAKEGEEVVAKV